MPDIREWISHVKRETTPDYWPDVRRWEGSESPAVSGGRGGSRRIVALATGVAAGALALVLAVQAFQQPPAVEPPPFAAKSNGIVAFLRADPQQAVREGELPETALFVVGPQGGDVERIVSRVERSATWSPDGTRIAYVQGGELHTIEIDSRATSLLVGCEAPCQVLGSAGWSPDGTQIAYSLQTARGLELWVRDVDGTASRMLRNDILFGAPTWSPDGRLLAVSGRVDVPPVSGPGPTPRPTPSGPGEEDGIFVIDAETGALVRTIELSGLDPGSTVDWSPDGEWLVFDAIGEGGVDYGIPTAEAGAGIYLIRPDGTDRRLLTSSSCEENVCTALHPEWSPDGEEVAFTRSLPELGSDGSLGDLYVIDVDAGDIRQITGGPGLDCCPAWQPLPQGAEPTIIGGRPESCPTVRFAVSQLPWLPAGSAVPGPEYVDDPLGTVAVWFEDAELRWSGRYFALKRSTKPLVGGDLSEFPKLRVRGHVAHLVWVGDPGIGELSIVWREGAAAAGCAWYSLTLGTARMSEEQAEATIREIAGSLEEAGSASTCAIPRVPQVELSRTSARPGTRVSFTGECFQLDWEGGYGLFLIYGYSNCELIAGAVDVVVEVEPTGHASGAFTVPATGQCFQSSPGPTPLPPGLYTVGVGCHACLTEATLRIRQSLVGE